jgi:hypothetical protein
MDEVEERCVLSRLAVFYALPYFDLRGTLEADE